MNRLRIIFRQALYSLRGNKVFSVAHFAGTAVSVSIVAVMVTFVNMKISDIYPEYGRNRNLMMSYVQEKVDGSSNVFGPNRKFAARFAEDIPHVEDICLVRRNLNNGFGTYSGNSSATLAEMYVDRTFWEIFGFEFIGGGPIPDDGYDAVSPQAVICESAAKALFGSEDCVGKSISRDSLNVSICGVVKDVSPLAGYSFSHIWLPEDADRLDPEWDYSITGVLSAGSHMILRIDRPSSAREVSDELDRRLDAFNAGNPDGVTYVSHGISSQRSMFFLNGVSNAVTVMLILVFTVVVIVPSLNTLGLVFYRMSRRREEFSIRRAYGAPSGSIVRQILEENLVLTSFGAAIGLLLALGFMKVVDRFLYRVHVLNLPHDREFWGLPSDLVRTQSFELSSFFRIEHFVIIVVCILVINIVSSLLPALKTVREDIVSGLNSKK